MEHPMSTSTAVHAVTDTSFAAEIAPGTGLVAVEFSAEWCGPCRMMAPILDAVATELGPKIRMLQMDTEADPATMVRYNVRSLPTLLVFHVGELVDQIIGAKPKKTLLDRLTRHLGEPTRSVPDAAAS